MIKKTKTSAYTLPPATIIMTFHAEGIYAYKSLLGFQRMRDYSIAQGNRVDLICILDKAESLTIQIVKKYIAKYGTQYDQIIETSYGSLSASRNTGTDHAATDYIGFLDGDDFFSANWVEEALKKQISAKETQILCMPGYVVSFGKHIACQIIQSRKHIPMAQMINNHYWVSSSFGHISTYQNHPYNEKVNKTSKFVFEDWDFNLRCITSGIEIEPVENTYLFYRRRENSMLTEHISYDSLVPPSTFFEQVNL